jgi:hypothetical protein
MFQHQIFDYPVTLFRNLYAMYNKDAILDCDITTAHKGIAVSQTREHSLVLTSGAEDFSQPRLMP